MRENQKIQTGLRIPAERYEELRAIAARSGVSLNALALYLIDVGLLAVNLGNEQVARSLPRIPECTAGQ